MTRIPTLLLTGANNHDWRRSAPFLQQLLEASGRFEVTLSVDPSTVLADAEALAAFALIFVDYNGPEWADHAKANFVRAVEQGTGLVILHAANNAFTGFVEYEKMCGICWRQGAGHGAFHEFEVTVTDHDHPITQGVADFRTSDELYHGLAPMHGVGYQVLATALSATDTGGSGKHEPMLLVSQYGRGRVFHQVLGHIWEGDPEGENRGASLVALENEGFQLTTLRGCEWAATGWVSIKSPTA